MAQDSFPHPFLGNHFSNSVLTLFSKAEKSNRALMRPSAILIVSRPRKYASLHKRLFPLDWGPMRTGILSNSSSASSMTEKFFTVSLRIASSFQLGIDLTSFELSLRG